MLAADELCADRRIPTAALRIRKMSFILSIYYREVMVTEMISIIAMGWRGSNNKKTRVAWSFNATTDRGFSHMAFELILMYWL